MKVQSCMISSTLMVLLLMNSSQCSLSTHVVSLYIVLWTFLIWLLILVKHLYLSGMWLRVTPRTDTKKTCSKKNWTLCSKI